MDRDLNSRTEQSFISQYCKNKLTKDGHCIRKDSKIKKGILLKNENKYSFNRSRLY